MDISVSGKHLDVGKALTEYIENKLEKIVPTYFKNAVNADIVATKNKNTFSITILINLGTGTQITVKSHEQGHDIYTVVDKACEKIHSRLRRYKNKITDRHKKQLEKEKNNLMSARKYVLSDETTQEDDNDSDDESSHPLIIAEKPTTIEHLSVSDAVMHMNLADLPAYMFINSKTGQINVVYRRKDGNISWINPQENSNSAAA